MIHENMTIDRLEKQLAESERDLATRDRELAEARDIADKYEAKADATAAERDRARGEIADLLARADADAFMLTQVGRERDAARAALAEKEREVARLKEDHAADLAVSDREEKLLEEHLAAAQEEAKGLREALKAIAGADDWTTLENGHGQPLCWLCEDTEHTSDCPIHIAIMALAARQRQPDGKKEDGRG